MIDVIIYLKSKVLYVVIFLLNLVLSQILSNKLEQIEYKSQVRIKGK